MPRYVDGFVLPVPKKNLAKYRRLAAMGAKIWKKHGALEYVEAVGEDLKPKGPMKVAQFGPLARAKSNETVVFSFIVYRSRSHRDAVNKKVMNDPMMAQMPMPMPFDVRRMAYGGFRAIVDA
jgi:uncharacterized protein YbaA (DUF1428 family)